MIGNNSPHESPRANEASDEENIGELSFGIDHEENLSIRANFDEAVLEKIEELHNSKELVFFADNEYLVQKAMQIQFSYLKRKDIALEMFANGQDLVQRLDNVLDSI